MAPADPTDRLPCDGMLEEVDVAMATEDANHEALVAMLRRHRAALASCRSHCWLRAQGESPG